VQHGVDEAPVLDADPLTKRFQGVEKSLPGK
jgi:hypothetical protein